MRLLRIIFKYFFSVFVHGTIKIRNFIPLFLQDYIGYFILKPEISVLQCRFRTGTVVDAKDHGCIRIWKIKQ